MKYLSTIFLFALFLAVSAPSTVRAEESAGLRGIYYDSTGDPITRIERNADIAAVRTDERISFRWSAANRPPVESDFFTAEWKGDLHPPATGTYTFAVIGDSAAALWINDELLIEGTPSDTVLRIPGTYEFTSSKGSFFELGRTYHLRLKTRHSRNNGLVQLWWRTPDGVWEVIPSRYLSAEPLPAVLPAGKGNGALATITQYIDSGTNYVTRTDRAVSLDLPPDFQNKGNFRIDYAWSGEIEPRISTFYRFYTSADGPITFALKGEDGKAEITSSSEGPLEQRTESVFLIAGKRYPFTLTYKQESGIARARLLWSNAVAPEKELVPRSQLYAPLRAQPQPKKQGTGLAGLYYNGERFEQQVFSRLDPTISFDWKRGSPKQGPVTNDHFSVKWQGEIEAQRTDFYQFSSRVDDRIKLTIDGHILLDTLPIRAGKTNHALPILLESGRRYPVTIEYAEYIDSAYVNLLWSGSDGKRELVGKNYLYPTPVPKAVAPISAETQGSGTGLYGEYFIDDHLSLLGITRIDPTIELLWGDGSPDPAIPRDHFSARWTGWIEAPESATYTFTVRVDDGIHLWIGDKDAQDVNPASAMLMNEWRRVSTYPTEYRVSKYLEQGKYPIRIEFYEEDSPAGIQLLWERNGRVREVVPRTYLYPAPEPIRPRGNGTGLRGRYYKGADTAGNAALPYPVFERTDAQVNFPWGEREIDERLATDNYSVRWEGFLQPQYEGTYTFHLQADDHAALYINETSISPTAAPLISTGSNMNQEYTGTKTLSRDRLYYIRVVYSEYSGDARVRLSWSHARIPKEVIPQTQFYLPNSSVLAPLGL